MTALFNVYVTKVGDDERKRLTLISGGSNQPVITAPFTWAQLTTHFARTIEPSPSDMVRIEIEPSGFKS